jgi:YfiH family protein
MPLPAVPDSFHWTEESWGAALRCRPLESLAPHLFTTRQLSLASAGDYQQLARAVGVDRVVTLTQVHGAAVSVVRKADTTSTGRDMSPPASPPEADVLVSDSPDVAIAVRAADCVPLLMADRLTGAVAAVHAGWRGTAARAAVAGLNALEREFGSRPADVVVAIGPSIGPCCYEVGSDLVDAFAAAGHERYLIDRWFSTPPAFADGFGGTSRFSRERPRLRLDVAGANRDQLILAGVPAEHIHQAGLCTAMHLDVLTSFRAEKENAGRIAGVIRARRQAAGST